MVVVVVIIVVVIVDVIIIIEVEIFVGELRFPVWVLAEHAYAIKGEEGEAEQAEALLREEAQGPEGQEEG